MYLIRTNISEIEPETWFGLDQLTRLELDRNELGVFTAGMFNHLASLTFLDLGNNKISAIDSEAFSNLTSLMVLNLIHNSISVLRRDMFLDLPNQGATPHQSPTVPRLMRAKVSHKNEKDC